MKPVAVIVLFVVLSSAFCRSRITSTYATARLLENAVQGFRDTASRLPTQEEGLGVLIDKPADWPEGTPWTPILETTDLPQDGWGHEYVYVLDSRLPRGFGVYSCGPDGVTCSGGNDRDDVASWNAASRLRRSRGMLAHAIEVFYPASLAVALLIAAGVLAAIGSAARRRPRAKP